MNLLTLSWRYLWSRPLATALNLLLLTLGLATVAFVLLAQDRVERAFERDLQGIDLVVDAKGSPLQLILAGVFHLDVPPGNVALADVRALALHPQVAQVIPLSLGDSLQAFRIVGTTPDYVAHYGATLAQGVLWAAPMQAVLGAQVARTTGLVVGQGFAGAHGLGGGGHLHEDTSYTVTGVLRPCGCALDRLVLTDTASVWAVHEGLAPGEFEALSAEDRSAIEAQREVTLALVRYRTPLAAVSLPRLVNTTTRMQAAAPAVEITRLLSMLGVGTRLLQGLGSVLLAVAGLSVFIALWGAVRERRADMAMLRMLGAPPHRLGALLLLEALWLALLACAGALLLAQGLGLLAGDLWAAGQGLIVDPWHWPAALWSVPALALGVALLAAALPAWSAYRVDVAALLSSSTPTTR
jgi:putative ABC transport system permease protein